MFTVVRSLQPLKALWAMLVTENSVPAIATVAGIFSSPVGLLPSILYTSIVLGLTLVTRYFKPFTVKMFFLPPHLAYNVRLSVSVMLSPGRYSTAPSADVAQPIKNLLSLVKLHVGMVYDEFFACSTAAIVPVPPLALNNTT